ncbi:MAG: HemK/PrmC family methyltransferase [Corynebacterium sp.]|nr:HemK/PrmC family methyltransferase [Corynebacterium sp.]
MASPLFDAQTIAAHILGIDRMSLRFADDFSPEQQLLFDDYVQRRAAREPLQHILGTAPFGPLDLKVGPGVFIPRPETEQLADWAATTALEIARSKAGRVKIVDFCTGSGAIACYIANVLNEHRVPAEIYAVELSPAAIEYAKANVSMVEKLARENFGFGYGNGPAEPSAKVVILHGSVDDLGLLEANGVEAHSLDLIVSNPPYVPEGSAVDEETTHDPHNAVFGGDTGMDLMPALFSQARRYGRLNSPIRIEHDDTTGPLMLALAAESGIGSGQIISDWAGKPRFFDGVVSSPD